MESCVTLPELGGTDHVEVEMIEAEPGDNDENEYEDGQQNEYTKLLNVSVSGIRVMYFWKYFNSQASFHCMSMI